MLIDLLNELDLTSLKITKTSHQIFDKLMELLKTKTPLKKMLMFIPKYYTDSAAIIKNNPYLRDELLLPIFEEMKIIKES